MNAEDADAVQFMDFASHIGYLGYTVTPPPVGAKWYTATHPARWKWAFTRWRGFLWLRCVVTLPKGVSAEGPRALEQVNELRLDARVAAYHLAHDDEEHLIEATAFLPIAYDRQAFGEWILHWVEDTTRISATAFHDHNIKERTR